MFLKKLLVSDGRLLVDGSIKLFPGRDNSEAQTSESMMFQGVYLDFYTFSEKAEVESN